MGHLAAIGAHYKASNLHIGAANAHLAASDAHAKANNPIQSKAHKVAQLHHVDQAQWHKSLGQAHSEHANSPDGGAQFDHENSKAMAINGQVSASTATAAATASKITAEQAIEAQKQAGPPKKRKWGINILGMWGI